MSGPIRTRVGVRICYICVCVYGKCTTPRKDKFIYRGKGKERKKRKKIKKERERRRKGRREGKGVLQQETGNIYKGLGCHGVLLLHIPAPIVPSRRFYILPERPMCW